MTLKELTQVVLNIRDNHLHHMQQDIDKLDKKLDKMDSRIWWVLGLLITSTVIAVITKLH